MNIKKMSMILILILIMGLMSCSQGGGAEELSYDGNLVLVGLSEPVEIAFNDIYKMISVSETYKTITSSGEEITTEVVGVSLNQLLETYDAKLSDFSSVRGVAGDGYAIDVPGEILADKDILLIWSEDGETFDEKKQPLRMAIHDERAMYWVSNLMTIEFISEKKVVIKESTETVDLSQILFIEAAAKAFDVQEITYYETEDIGVQVTDLLTLANPSDPVVFVATDNFEKTETLEVINQGLFKLTGDNAPLFMSPDLPKGMHVKYILQMITGDTAFVSEMNALEVYSEREVKNQTGVALEDVIAGAGLNAESYLIASTDGYEVEIAAKDLVEGILSLHEDGYYQVKFSDALAKNTNVKDVLSIKEGSGANVVEVESTETTTEDVLLGVWTVEVTGLDDGAFEFTSERAERKLDRVTIETIKTSKNGDSATEFWEGYKILDILAFLKVEDFESITVIAADGYSKEFTKEDVDMNMILGVVKNGAPLEESDNLVQLVSKLPSNTWIKGIVKIEVK